MKNLFKSVLFKNFFCLCLRNADFQNVFLQCFSLHYTEISSVRCSMMKSIQAVSSLNPQSPRLAGHIQEMGEYFCASSQNFEKYSLLPTEVLFQNSLYVPKWNLPIIFAQNLILAIYRIWGFIFVPQIKTSKISSYLLKVSSRASNLLLSPEMPTLIRKNYTLYATTRSRNLHPIFAKAVTRFVDA